jgi:hypothetical protein
MITKIRALVEELNQLEAEKLKKEGYINSAFFNQDGSLTDNYKVSFKEKQKYFYIDFGSSGVFMISKEEIKGQNKSITFNFPIGSIFNIKGYGTPDFNKKLKSDLGNINTITDIKALHNKRWNYLK